MSYKMIQALAKENGIPANKKVLDCKLKLKHKLIKIAIIFSAFVFVKKKNRMFISDSTLLFLSRVANFFVRERNNH